MVWLTQEEIAILFDCDQGVISRHIRNIFLENELNKDTSMQKMHKSQNVSFSKNRPPVFYNLDVIISAGYRVKSKRDVAFRKWVNSVLKDYLIQGYSVNQKRLEALGKTIDIQKWLTQREMSLLFNVSNDSIGLHIRNIFKDDELDFSTTEESSVVQKEGNRTITRNVKIYNLDMIIAVGYRVKSKRGLLFRRWANSVLKDYLIKGYAANQKPLEALGKTIDIQNRMLAYSLNIDKEELSKSLTNTQER